MIMKLQMILYKDGAENHQSKDGDFNSRKRNAIQAFSEYLPVKTFRY